MTPVKILRARSLGKPYMPVEISGKAMLSQFSYVASRRHSLRQEARVSAS